MSDRIESWIERYSAIEAAFGEVIGSTHSEFRVQAYSCMQREEENPTYGSLVVVNSGNRLVIGLVVETRISPQAGLPSLPTLLKLTREEIRQQYPDLEDKFQDEYRAVTIGYYEGGRFYQTRPPRKPLIHDLAFLPSREFVRSFHTSEGYLKMEYFPLVIQSIPESEIIPLMKAYIPYLVDNLGESDDVLDSIYSELSGSLIDQLGERIANSIIAEIERMLFG